MAKSNIILSCIAFIFIFQGLVKSQDTDASSVNNICLQATSSCSACILAHPSCTWCSHHDETTNRGQVQSRCQTLSENQKKCPTNSISNPENNFTALHNLEFSNGTDGNPGNIIAIQLRPQEVEVHLRQGVSQVMNFTFRRVIDYPLDLYYVMDLSYSMGDDLDTLQRLGTTLVNGIKNLTNNVHLGFGTFVDKVVLPFTSTIPAQLENPCLNDDNGHCAPVFGFRHQLAITPYEEDFISEVRSTNISGNIDVPEGGFDALMQIAMCQKQIKWRNASLRVILYASDARPHYAMDGKLAAILDINDMGCYLEKFAHPEYPNSYIYAKSKTLDYPSIGQLKKAFSEKKIQPVFAVTKDVFPFYEKIRDLLNPAYADILDSNSSNIIEIISNAYEKIRSQVQLNRPTVPENVDLTYRVLCPDSSTWVENSLECSNVFVGDEVTFQFELSSSACSVYRSNQVIDITSNTIQDTAKINLDVICNCECEGEEVIFSPSCRFRGNFTCGQCRCNPGFEGTECQCNNSDTTTSLEKFCTSENYTEGVSLCNSPNGYCECGECQCVNGHYGRYCQCSNTGCADSRDGICGGPDKGRCENCNNNPQCICRTGFKLDSLGSCTCSDESCKNENGDICSGNGNCTCNECTCDSKYSGTFCDRCVSPECIPFSGDCSSSTIEKCASCLYEADRLNKQTVSECQKYCTDEGIKYDIVSQIPNCTNCNNGIFESICSTCNTFTRDASIHVPTRCETNTFSTCIAQYLIVWSNTGKDYVLYVKRFEQSDCPQVDPLPIALPVVGAVVLIGIIALILWKIIQTIRDKHEYERFMVETKNPKWGGKNNDLYVSPNARIANPTYVGN